MDERTVPGEEDRRRERFGPLQVLRNEAPIVIRASYGPAISLWGAGDAIMSARIPCNIMQCQGLS